MVLGTVHLPKKGVAGFRIHAQLCLNPFRMCSIEKYSSPYLQASYVVTAAKKLIVGQFATICCVWCKLLSSKFSNPTNDELTAKIRPGTHGGPPAVSDGARVASIKRALGMVQRTSSMAPSGHMKTLG